MRKCTASLTLQVTIIDSCQDKRPGMPTGRAAFSFASENFRRTLRFYLARMVEGDARLSIQRGIRMG